MPSRAPSGAAPTSTTIGWNVKGTGVNGSGMLICAATAVKFVTKSTAPICSPNRSARASSRTTRVPTMWGAWARILAQAPRDAQHRCGRC